MNPIENNTHTTAPRNDGDRISSACNSALIELCRALKAITFYPENHPLRENILDRSYQAVVSLMKNGAVHLVVQRNGLSLVNQEGAIDNTPTIIALAKELFIREIKYLTLQPELSLKNFIEFLSLLALEPQKIISGGGFAEMLAKQGIRTVISGEIDISAVYTKIKAGETSDGSVAEKSLIQKKDEKEINQVEVDVPDSLNDLNPEELLAQMSTETDDSRYCQLARILMGKGQSLKMDGDFDRLFPILVGLLDQKTNETRTATQRDCAFLVFQQLALGEMTEHLLGHLDDKEFGQKEMIYRILKEQGSKVVDAVVRRLVTAVNQFSRSMMATALLRIGLPAVPALLEVLESNRWHDIHTAAAILGEMRSRDAVKGLILIAYHSDIRLRMEAIRSLAKIGGREATEALIALLKDDNLDVRKQAIMWMGSTRNPNAIQSLIQVVTKWDPFGKTFEIKREALIAIGHIGDVQAIDPLSRLVKRNTWLMPNSYLELQILAVETIARLGGDSSRALLEKLSARGGRIGRACTAVLKSMGQRTVHRNE